MSPSSPGQQTGPPNPRRTDALSTDWIREGAQVAELHDGYDKRVTLTTIAKLTKTQIVLTNENRYNRATQKAIGKSRLQLLPAEALLVRRVRDRTAYQSMAMTIERIDLDVRNERTNIYDALDAIEQAVREARAAIDRRNGEQ